MLVGCPLSVPRAWRHRYDALGGNRERRTDASATPGIGKPLRAFSGIGIQDDPSLAVAQGDDTPQEPSAGWHAAPDLDQGPET